MNQKIYNTVCSKIGHNWAFKDCDTFMKKVCLDCGAEQIFFPEEVNENENLQPRTEKLPAILEKAKVTGR